MSAPNATKPQDFARSARRLLGLLGPERVRVGWLLVLTLVAVVLNVIGPRILGSAVDKIFDGAVGGAMTVPAGTTKDAVVAQLRAVGDDTKADMIARMDLVPGVGIDFGAVGRILLLVLGLYVVSAACQLVQARMLNRVVQTTMRGLRNDVEAKIHRLPLRELDGRPRGELLSRMTNDIDNIGQSLQQTVSQVLLSGLAAIGVLVMMFTISWPLTLIALVAIPIVMVVTRQVMKRSQGLFVKQWQHTGALNAQIEEAYTGHALVKVFGRQREVHGRFTKQNDELMSVSWRAQFISGLLMPIMLFVGNLQYVAVCVIGGVWIASGTISIGQVTAFVQYSRQFTQPLTQLGAMVNLLQSGVASAERVFEVLDTPEETPEESAPLPATGGRVEFDAVSFHYAPTVPVLQDVSLTIEPGHTVAVVGPTGAGKTTLVNLLLRFYDVDSGTIRVDGTDISTVPRRELRARFGMVLQDSWLFHGTIRDNIAFGRPGASEEEILRAARTTFVDRFVRSLPDGYDTMIDEEGSNVSAGERQLITIARAFLADPDLLILDEATSSVDTRTEVLLQQAMDALRADRTSVVIAHRLSTIRDADEIVVLDGGRIVEQGAHEELMDADGHYRHLYLSQFEQPAAAG